VSGELVKIVHLAFLGNFRNLNLPYRKAVYTLEKIIWIYNLIFTIKIIEAYRWIIFRLKCHTDRNPEKDE